MDERPKDDQEGLRSIGDAAGGFDDDGSLPHWSESASSGALAGSEPTWDDTHSRVDFASEDLDRSERASDSEFNPSLLPPEGSSDWDNAGSYETPSYQDDGDVYSENPDDFGAMPRISTDEEDVAQVTDGKGGGRDLPTAVLAGVGLAVIALICFTLGKPATVVLLAVALGAAAMEWFHNLRQVGYSPATLLGIAACAVAPIATYWRGVEAMPMVIFFSLVVGSLWYLLGVGSERPVPNLGVTMLGISYIGILGSYGALMLKEPNGIGMLLAAVIVTVAYDVGALFVGTTVGRSPLSEASPNKTKEGLVGGGLLAIAAAVGVVGIGGITPFGDVPGGVMPEALALGLVAAVMAPLGDLFESLMKRDLGVKDMGSILPGHGGILDRFDALLFVLPSTYYLVRLFDLF